MNFLFPYLARWKTINWSRYHQLFTRLAERGHHVYVIQPPKSAMPETNFQEIDVQVPANLHLIDLEIHRAIWDRTFPLNKLVKKGTYAVACLNKVNEVIRDKKIDVVMLYNIPQYFIQPNGCFTIFDYADDYMDMLKKELGALSNPLVMGLGSSMLKKMIQRSDVTLAVSHVLAKQIQHWDDQVIVLPNGADAKEKPDAKIDFTRPAQGAVIGFIGSFEYFIDFDLILAAAERRPQHTFLLVGGGRELKYVKEQMAQRNLRNIALTGSVPHSKVAAYINAMDVCLNIFKKMPVSHGACPIKMFEYMIMKKPVISTRLEEVEIIDKDQRIVFYADTPDEMTERIDYVLSSKDVAEQYARRAYDVTMKRYSWDSIVDELIKIIERKRGNKR